MPATTEIALDHAARRRRTVRAAADAAKEAWRRIDPARIAQSWTTLSARLTLVVSAAQRVAAGHADQYLDDALDAQNLSTEATARTIPAALAGIASDGRPLGSLLYQPAISTLVGIQDGLGVDHALASGFAHLSMLVRTQVADAGRAADQVATAARPGAGGYVRMLAGNPCSRCAVLAGRWYRYNAGFKRHPCCGCIGIPGRENTSDDLRTDPKAYFSSLSASEQDQIFTKAGAEAIRHGADIGKVVNARRGMATADVFGRRAQITTEARGRLAVRLMPETILREAGSRDEALRLLKLHGYLA